jgi:hypothetical protein
VWRQAWAQLAGWREGRDARLEEDLGDRDRTCEADPFRLTHGLVDDLPGGVAGQGAAAREVLR